MRPENIPAELRAAPFWLTWRREEDPVTGKIPKVPYYTNGNRRKGDQGSTKDRKQLATFDAALKAAQDHGHDGIGIAMLPDLNTTAIDLDHCVGADGRIAPAVLEALDGTYAELSPSGMGVRGFVRGNVMRDRNSDSLPAPAEGIGKLELFYSGQFVTVTGNMLDDGDRDLFGWGVEDANACLHQLYALARAKRGPARESSGDMAFLIDPAEVTDETIEDLDSALMFLAEMGDGDDYNECIANGNRLKSLERAGRAEQAFGLWMKYAAACKKFNDQWARDKWARNLRCDQTAYKAIFRRAQELGWKNPRKKKADDYSELVDRTDTGNANLLRHLTEGNLRFIPERKAWMWWDGQCWTVDDAGALAQREALRVAEHYLTKAAELDAKAADPALSADERKRIEKAAQAVRAWATHCRNRRAMEAMLAVASRDPRMTVPAVQLDRDPWLLGVVNGVVDLRNGTLRPAGRDDMVTKRTTVAFAPDAQAPRWRQFIAEITGTPVQALFDPAGDVIPSTVGQFKERPDLARYLQLAAGYALTGSTAEQKMFIAVGAGSNGKNIMLDTLQSVAGDYWCTIPPESLMAMRHDTDAERPSPVAARLAGTRAAISSESRDGQRLDVALVKRHTGGGYMTARLMRENSFQFEITHKLWLMTNHRPAPDHMDEAIRGRLHIIPFDRVWNRPGHPDHDPAMPDGDKNLKDTLAGETAGILAWLVQGAVAHHLEGLKPPAAVVGMTRDFFKDMDALGRWIADACEQCSPDDGARSSELFSLFGAWCAEHGVRDGRSQRAFSLALEKHGIKKKDKADGAHWGLRLVDPGLF